MITAQGFYESEVLMNLTVNWLVTINVSTSSTTHYVHWDFKGINR